MILEKSLFDKLWSPINFILLGERINKAKINLPRFPEFPAFRIKFFLKLKQFNPLPLISQ